ncbi:acyltransferase [Streptomyces griseoflavus Tu4000]|uniref:Acyltransferase n=1 Tax=Streptomyces griseoflavus Tu4000 TaxID=467200 RepID=D9XPK6_9ACTN|nr:acyltransferase [Streptomyces griseoflavus Tu4000]
MLSRAAAALLPLFGRLTVTRETEGPFPAGSVFVANHDSTADPALVLAALRRAGVTPVVMATAGLWRVPVLGRALTREGHVPVHRGSARAADALEAAAEAVRAGRHVLIYAEGGLPSRLDAACAAPRTFRTGLARPGGRTGAPLVPVRSSGGPTGWPRERAPSNSPVCSPRRCAVRVCTSTSAGPCTFRRNTATGTATAHRAVGAAWQRAARAVGEPALRG